jgi:hypothetical protein
VTMRHSEVISVHRDNTQGLFPAFTCKKWGKAQKRRELLLPYRRSKLNTSQLHYHLANLVDSFSLLVS